LAWADILNIPKLLIIRLIDKSSITVGLQPLILEGLFPSSSLKAPFSQSPADPWNRCHSNMPDFKQTVRDQTAHQLNTPASANVSESKQDFRDQTAHQLNIPAASANALKEQGEDSAKRRGISFEPAQLRFPNPTEENSMHQAGEESLERRKHVTENIANSYRSSSS
jgi:hypothetical protein